MPRLQCIAIIYTYTCGRKIWKRKLAAFIICGFSFHACQDVIDVYINRTTSQTKKFVIVSCSGVEVRFQHSGLDLYCAVFKCTMKSTLSGFSQSADG